MLIVTTDLIADRQITKVHGLVGSSGVWSKNVAKDIGAGLKSLVGGELVSYTRLLEEARVTVIEQMVDEALELGANAITGIRISTSGVAGGAAEIYVYGTAVSVANPG